MLRKSRNRSLSGDKGNVFYEFLVIFGVVLMVSLFLSGFAASQLNTPEGMSKVRSLFGIAFFFSLFITVGLNVVAKFVGHGLYLGGSKVRDDGAILKGMYEQAHGLRITSQPKQSEKIYKQILIENPEQLEARFYLGNLYWKNLRQGKRALREFKALEKKIREENLKFRYISVLKESIRDLKDDLAEASEE